MQELITSPLSLVIPTTPDTPLSRLPSLSPSPFQVPGAVPAYMQELAASPLSFATVGIAQPLLRQLARRQAWKGKGGEGGEEEKEKAKEDGQSDKVCSCPKKRGGGDKHEVGPYTPHLLSAYGRQHEGLSSLLPRTPQTLNLGMGYPGAFSAMSRSFSPLRNTSV